MSRRIQSSLVNCPRDITLPGSRQFLVYFGGDSVSSVAAIYDVCDRRRCLNCCTVGAHRAPLQLGPRNFQTESLPLLLATPLGGIMLLREQLEAHGLRAFLFNIEIARHINGTDVEGV